MNHMIPARRLAAFAAAPAPEGEAEEGIRLGMPQLSARGLSENWLLKDLGHRHWTALAEAAGREGPDFRDEAGQPVYAAFCAVRLETARLDLARENGRLAIRSRLRRLSRTQVASRHELVIDGRAGGAVEMVSAFIRRTGSGNHAVARVGLDGLMPIDPHPSDLAATAASLRTGRLRSHFGMDLSHTKAGIASYEFEPCPDQDFNGAGFLYFPSFLAFVDRAEWRRDRTSAPLARRDAFYYGNLDPGDALRIILVADWPDARARRWRIARASDDTILADVFVQRREDIVPARPSGA